MAVLVVASSAASSTQLAFLSHARVSPSVSTTTTTTTRRRRRSFLWRLERTIEVPVGESPQFGELVNIHEAPPRAFEVFLELSNLKTTPRAFLSTCQIYI